MSQEIAVKMESITKHFGTVAANHEASLTVRKGEIHALLGENGAGKSTLMNMLSGIYTPDSGSIFIHGKRVHFASPRDAILKGIGMVHQHFKLVDVLSAKENIIAGQKGSFLIRSKKVEQQMQAVSRQFGLELDLNKKIYSMSVAEKQTVEILKVLYRGADILILDEPTAVLTPQEIQGLFGILRKMKESGCAVIIITHKLQEVMEICDKVTVLRKGETIQTLNIHETNPKALTDLMVGRAVDLSIGRPQIKRTEPMLDVRNLTVLDEEKIKVLDQVSFQVHGGEILGVAGIAGSGQKELCEVIAGLYSSAKGSIFLKGEAIDNLSPREIIHKGISMSFIPEDRLGMGLVASMDMVDNLLLKEYQNQKGIFIDRRPIREKAERLVKTLDIKTPSIHHPVKQLSGGNIQKVLLGRELEAEPELIITAYAVRGLDIGASYQIYDLLNEQKKKNVGILFIGEDLDVLLQLCDRILVLCDGKVTGLVDAKKTTKEELGFLMAGEHLEEDREGGSQIG